VDFARELSLFLHFAESTPLASNVVIDGEGSVVASRFVLQSTAVVSPNEDAQVGLHFQQGWQNIDRPSLCFLTKEKDRKHCTID
jgi:hypothetical protein